MDPLNKTRLLPDLQLRARPISKSLLSNNQPRFLNTIAHPRELELLSASSNLSRNTKTMFFNTIAHPQELELLAAKSGAPPHSQMQPLSVRPKRLNNKRSRKPCNESSHEGGDAARKHIIRNKNKNSKPHQRADIKTCGERFGQRNTNQHFFSEADALDVRSSYFEQPASLPYSEHPDFNQTYSKPVGWERDRPELQRNFLQNNGYDRYGNNSCLGILHAKMDPEQKPECAFCKRNNAKDYHHHLKDSAGGVVCPVLSAFTCKMCAATGRNAHTHKYCPVNPITKGDPVGAGMPPGRPLTKVDKQWLKYFHARFILDLFFRNRDVSESRNLSNQSTYS